MNKKKTLLIAGILLVNGLIFGTMAYFMFHYLTPAGVLSSAYQTEAQKPLVTYAASFYSALNIFGALVFLLLGLIKYSENKKLN